MENSLSNTATQQVINVQIIAQLSSISDRLIVLEQKKVTEDLDPKKKKEVLKKKSSTQVTPVTLPQNQCLPSGMPSLQNIRQDAFMRQVDDERLRDLAQNENAGKRLNLLGVALWRSWF